MTPRPAPAPLLSLAGVREKRARIVGHLEPCVTAEDIANARSWCVQMAQNGEREGATIALDVIKGLERRLRTLDAYSALTKGSSLQWTAISGVNEEPIFVYGEQGRTPIWRVARRRSGCGGIQWQVDRWLENEWRTLRKSGAASNQPRYWNTAEGAREFVEKTVATGDS